MAASKSRCRLLRAASTGDRETRRPHARKAKARAEAAQGKPRTRDVKILRDHHRAFHSLLAVNCAEFRAAKYVLTPCLSAKGGSLGMPRSTSDASSRASSSPCLATPPLTMRNGPLWRVGQTSSACRDVQSLPQRQSKSTRCPFKAYFEDRVVPKIVTTNHDDHRDHS